MAGIKTTIEIEVESVNPFETKAKTRALTDLAQLDSDVLSKLAELGKIPSAVQQLKTNFSMIKGFLS